MAAEKKVTLQVISDAVQFDGETYPNGQQFQVTEAQAKELLKTDKVRQGLMPEPP